MGKRKQRRRNQPPQGASKRPKLRKYWIEDFPELLLETSDISLLITRINLSDAHHARPQSETVPVVASAADPSVERNIVLTKSTTDDPALKIKTSEDMVNLHCEGQNDFILNETTGTKYGTARDKQSDLSACKEAADEKISPTRNVIVSVQRASYAPLCFKRDPKFRHKKNGDCGDGIINPYPKTEVPDKFWAQRKRLFSRFAEGIQLDPESWYSVTPEVIANHIAQRVIEASKKKEGMILLEAFCGAGGNAIAFARRPEVSKVICVDINLQRLKMAAHNCGVYEIPKDKVVFIHADACAVLKTLASERKETAVDEPKTVISGYDCGSVSSLPHEIDAIFFSPPWGGTEYVKLGPRQYSLSHIQLEGGVDGEELLRLASKAFRSGQDTNMAIFLPRNLNGLSFAQSAYTCGHSGTIELEMDLIDSKFKAITAYISKRSDNAI
ncbi:trimethylguanosine synthase [Fistulifera solaris]|uniref:Trimethylguanosine synthase n=1 Tax=Fistulifera solaris TaxID=1519565 RepID=A0A1Z5KAG6_FISSO|nr:trimethylguanosine synthase [Fistulifera solaris]|eukprot:GAX23253.1 trimethylguanosine synthase [Fistulifera solaris]